MATIRLPTDFKEFLQLLNLYKVKYLLVGGYAVCYHGYPRAAKSLEIWMTWSTYPDFPFFSFEPGNKIFN